MIWKLGWKEFCRDLWMNLIIVVQMALLLVIAIAAMTSVLSRMQYYQPVKEWLSNDGAVFYMEPYQTPASVMRAAVSEHAELDFTYHYSSVNCQVFVYDDDIWEKCQPALEEKLPKAQVDANYPQVYAPRWTGYSLGQLVVLDEEEPSVAVQVAGILATDEPALGFNKYMSDEKDFRMLFTTPDQFDGGNDPTVITAYSEIEKLPAIQEFGDDYMGPRGIAFLRYTQPVDRATVAKDMEALAGRHTQLSINNEDMQENSITYIYGEVIALIPVLIGIMILLIISMFSVNAVTTVRQLRSYAVYRICGLTWSTCGRITAIRAVYVSLASLLFCGVVMLLKEHTPILKNYLIELDIPQILVVLATVTVNMLISIAISTTIVRRSEPNELLKAN